MRARLSLVYWHGSMPLEDATPLPLVLRGRPCTACAWHAQGAGSAVMHWVSEAITETWRLMAVWPRDAPQVPGQPRQQHAVCGAEHAGARGGRGHAGRAAAPRHHCRLRQGRRRVHPPVRAARALLGSTATQGSMPAEGSIDEVHVPQGPGGPDPAAVMVGSRASCHSLANQSRPLCASIFEQGRGRCSACHKVWLAHRAICPDLSQPWTVAWTWLIAGLGAGARRSWCMRWSSGVRVMVEIM